MKRIALVLAIAVAACGPNAVFRLSADENNPYALNEALGTRRLPAQPTPTNSAQKPRAFVLAAGKPKTIVAFDLAAQNVLWKVDADVQSRIAVGGDFIVALEGTQLVARDQSNGAPRWKADLGGTFVGLAADRERAYVVTKDGSDFVLAGYSSGGKRLWQSGAAGQLGAPAAHGGVVYVPFLSQWLSIVNGATGEQLTRVRGIDEQISTLRVSSTVAYYGSKGGVFRLDERSASGKRADATYGKVEIPPQLERTTYAPDAYDAVQQTYTAADRSRVLWSSDPSGSTGPMKLAGDGYAIHYFRYVLGFDLAGELRWAYSHPRVELVASAHTGSVIVGIAQNGDVVAIDPQTGAVRSRGSLGIGAQVVGATFDADGWAPTSQTEKIETVPALVSIARDRDARFERVKELAVGALAKLPGAEVTAELLAVITDDRQPIRLKDTVAELLVKRRDPAGLPVLTQNLAKHDDVIAKTETDVLGPLAKAIAGLGGTKLDAESVTAALVALQYHLDAPSTATADLVHVIAAMASIGGGAERPALISHLLLYHTDDDRGSDAAWQKAIISALMLKGSSADREALRYVETDPRTIASLATAIRESIGVD